MENYQILEKIKTTGQRVFYNPMPLLDYNFLATHTLANNTYRGFHKLDKEGPGAKEAFEHVLLNSQKVIVQSINHIKSEKDMDLFAKELSRALKARLSKCIRNDQLESFNKIRKPVDIILEHFISMGSDFVKARERITKYLFLPLDSQMFQSPDVFSEAEARMLRIDRNFTFKDIYDEGHYVEIQTFLKEKAENLGIDRIFFDLIWNNRFNSEGRNLFATNPKNPAL